MEGGVKAVVAPAMAAGVAIFETVQGLFSQGKCCLTPMRCRETGVQDLRIEDMFGTTVSKGVVLNAKTTARMLVAPKYELFLCVTALLEVELLENYDAK